MVNPMRGFPTAKQSTGLFFAPPALFEAQVFRSLRTAPRALPLDPTVFLKKDGQKLLDILLSQNSLSTG